MSSCHHPPTNVKARPGEQMLCQTGSAPPQLYSGMSGSRGVTFPQGGFVDKIKLTWVLECTQAHLR